MIVAIVIGAVAVAALAHTAPFAFLLDAFSGKLTIWRVQPSTGQKAVYLTFDDGPNPTATPGLLDVLREENIHATFFLIDRHVTGETAPIIRRMFDEGHGVALHSGNRWLMLRSPSGLAAKLAEDSERIERLTGRRPCPLFRPHGGWRSVPMLQGVSRAGFRMAGWSWMSWDWVWFRKRTAERVARQVTRNAAPGKIVVIHDGHHADLRADRQYAIDAARLLVRELRQRGYGFGSLCEAAAGR